MLGDDQLTLPSKAPPRQMSLRCPPLASIQACDHS